MVEMSVERLVVDPAAAAVVVVVVEISEVAAPEDS